MAPRTGQLPVALCAILGTVQVVQKELDRARVARVAMQISVGACQPLRLPDTKLLEARASAVRLILRGLRRHRAPQQVLEIPVHWLHPADSLAWVLLRKRREQVMQDPRRM